MDKVVLRPQMLPPEVCMRKEPPGSLPSALADKWAEIGSQISWIILLFALFIRDHASLSTNNYESCRRVICFF